MRSARVPRSPAAGAAAAFLLAFALWASLFVLQDANAGEGFDAGRWERTAVYNKWVFALGAPIRSDPGHDEAIERYFSTSSRLRSDEGRRLENVVEAAIEGRIDAVLRAQGVSARFSLPGPLAVWPPVDIEIAPAPQLLVVSPRAEIDRIRSERLRPDLASQRAVEIEAEVERGDERLSALVTNTGGAAGIYPPIIAQVGSFSEAVATAAHEWTHLYLDYYPLGDFGGERRAINETVAVLAGDEVRDLVLARFGEPDAGTPSTAPLDVAEIDFSEVMRELRIEVDALLAAGEIEAAERRMEEAREFLDDEGIYLRRINQAYFAFFGDYTAGPASPDPLGDQLREIRRRAGSLGAFLELVRELSGRAEVEALLAELGEPGG